MMMEPEDGDSRSAHFVFILIEFFLMAGMFVVAIVAQLHGGTLGVFGDFFSGAEPDLQLSYVRRPPCHNRNAAEGNP